MSLEFLTPIGAVLGVGAVVTLIAFAVAETRARRVASTLRLPPTPRRVLVPVAVSLAAVPLLLGVAAAQPVLETTHKRYVRGDAEAFFVFDTSRSMLASASADAPTRMERARAEAIEVRRSLAEVPVGIATLTNRLLPHLFPSSGQAVFARTLDRSIDIERPPPNKTGSIQITNYTPLAAMQRQNYFDASASHRLLVVFTDGETRFPADERLRRALLQPPGVRVIFVHVANKDERVFFESGLAEPAYRPDPNSMERLDHMAASVRGWAFEEDQLGDVERTARTALGSGVEVRRGTERRSHPLAPYVALAAFLPLGLILRLRNL